MHTFTDFISSPGSLRIKSQISNCIFIISTPISHYYLKFNMPKINLSFPQQNHFFL